MNVIQADVGVAGIHAFTTLRAKGTSDAPFQSLNFGDHVGDCLLYTSDAADE